MMIESEDNRSIELVALTADVISAYVAKNAVPVSALPELISDVHRSLSNLDIGLESVEEKAPTPAVNPKRSVHNDHIVCLEDGKKFKSLKRHLMTHHGMTPDEYREKWNLPKTYPMVAPGYAAARSELAKKMGLGRKPKEAKPEPVKRRRKKAAS